MISNNPSPNLPNTVQFQGQAPVQEQAPPTQIEKKDRNVSELKVKIASPNLEQADPAKAAKLRQSMALTGASLPVSAGNVEKNVNTEGKKLVEGKIEKKNTQVKKEAGDPLKFREGIANLSAKIKAVDEKARGINEKLDKAKDFKEIETLNRDLTTLRSDLQKLQGEMKSHLSDAANSPKLQNEVSAEDLKNPQFLRSLIQADHKMAMSLINKHDVDVKEAVNDMCKTPAGRKVASEFCQTIVKEEVAASKDPETLFRQTQTPTQQFLGSVQSNLMGKVLEKTISENVQREKSSGAVDNIKTNVSTILTDIKGTFSKSMPPEMKAVYKTIADAYKAKYGEAGLKGAVTSFLFLKEVNPKLVTAPGLSKDDRANVMMNSKVLQLVINNNTEAKGEAWQMPLKGYPEGVQLENNVWTKDGKPVEGEVRQDPNNFVAASQQQVNEIYNLMVG